MGLQFSRVAASFVVQVSRPVLEQHMVASPEVVGEELARQVALYAQQNSLGYYPALDYFLEHGGVDAELLNAVESMTWLVTGLVREEIKTRLRPVFSNIRFESIQTLAYTMPSVRPGQNNTLLRLGEHFTPDRVKVAIVATSIRHRDTPETAVKMAERMIWRWLHEHFEKIEITHTRYLPPDEDDSNS
ncbi:hypothetical protein [Thiohalophilus sp.]|uniref:hypothetical protein n=1 Tax=Thiohalophilus sp. TaxID=3028392 RepID=UPI002ACD541F|nr:hypothetical protein [Thiohalophilus sp.]MDZ7804479.1 hypothetical protein [Thiohalophilus sp.]